MTRETRGQRQGAAGWRPPGRKRWTLADGRELVEAVALSGESDASFGQAHRVATHRIRYWRTKTGREAPRQVEPQRAVRAIGFIPMNVVDDVRPPAPAPAERPCVEVHLDAGGRLVFRGSWDVDAITPWLRALGARPC